MRERWLYLGMIVLGVGLIPVALSLLPQERGASSIQAEDGNIDAAMRACFTAQGFVRAQLYSASRAEFPDCGADLLRYQIRTDAGQSRWFVRGPVNAPDSLGRQTSRTFEVDMAVVGNQWHALAVRFSE